MARLLILGLLVALAIPVAAGTQGYVANGFTIVRFWWDASAPSQYFDCDTRVTITFTDQGGVRTLSQVFNPGDGGGGDISNNVVCARLAESSITLTDAVSPESGLGEAGCAGVVPAVFTPTSSGWSASAEGNCLGADFTRTTRVSFNTGGLVDTYQASDGFRHYTSAMLAPIAKR